MGVAMEPFRRAASSLTLVLGIVGCGARRVEPAPAAATPVHSEVPRAAQPSAHPA